MTQINDVFCDVSLARYWDNLLDLQTELMLPLEWPLFYRSDQWGAAHTVLDIGCGNGRYIYEISKKFPNKSYIGIDQSTELINIAKSKYGSNIKFIECDFNDFQESVDFVIARALVQYLPSIEGFFQRLNTVIRPGGGMLIIERDDIMPFHFEPPAENIVKAVYSVEERQEQNRVNNVSTITGLANAYNQQKSISLINEQLITVSNQIPGNHKKIMEAYQVIMKIVSKFGANNEKIKKGEEEVKDWFSSDGYTDMRLRAFAYSNAGLIF